MTMLSAVRDDVAGFGG